MAVRTYVQVIATFDKEEAVICVERTAITGVVTAGDFTAARTILNGEL